MDIKQYSPATLAFLGDSVYELYIREMLVKKANTSAGNLHNEKIKLVCCEKQAEIADRILPLLNETELSVFKRGRNSDVSPPKHAKPAEYRKSTGFEALIGYLYLTDKDRLFSLTEQIQLTEFFEV